MAGVSTCNFHVDAVFLCPLLLLYMFKQITHVSLSNTNTNAHAKADTVQPD